MDYLFIAIIFAILPIISYILQYHFSKKDKTLRAFRNNWTVYYSDWLFVPFNFILIYLFILNPSLFNLKIFLFSFLFSLVANVWIHFYYWMNIHIREKSEAHMFNLSKKKLLPAGWDHFFFSLIEMTLILSLFFLDLRSFFGYFSLFLLSLFFASFFITSKHIHKRMIISDLVISLFGIVVILIKFLFSIF